MQIDIFKADAFSLTQITAAINKIPFYPTRLYRDQLFTEEPISTTSVEIESTSEGLVLVPDRPRGAPGQVVNVDRRQLRQFKARHLPQIATVLADEVQNLRAFGTESEEETAMGVLTRKMAIARRRIDLTVEWQRVGAIKGIVLDSDGSTPLTDLYSAFGISQQVQDMTLDVSGADVLGNLMSAKRKSEDELGGVSNTGWRVYSSSTFFDAFVRHDAVKASFAYFNTSGFSRSDNRGGFVWGTDVEWVEYRGQVGNIKFIEDDAAYMVPLGVPDLFKTYYAPAPYMETVNTPGLPFYASPEMMDHGKGVEVECQSNPLVLNTRPRAIIKLII